MCVVDNSKLSPGRISLDKGIFSCYVCFPCELPFSGEILFLEDCVQERHYDVQNTPLGTSYVRGLNLGSKHLYI